MIKNDQNDPDQQFFEWCTHDLASIVATAMGQVSFLYELLQTSLSMMIIIQYKNSRQLKS